MARLRLATVWLGGCSGCHMSFLDMDEFLFELAGGAELVYSPLLDVKEYPADVDAALVEGAVANEEHWRMLQTVRANTKTLIAFGDCAVTGNVTALRNLSGSALEVLNACYAKSADVGARNPTGEPLPPLLDRVVPLHAATNVDYFLPGCPPDASAIRALLEALLDGRKPSLSGEQIRFG